MKIVNFFKSLVLIFPLFFLFFISEGMSQEGKMMKTNQEWKEILSPEAYEVLRKKGTEAPFTGKLLKNKEKGVYVCGACGHELFDSEAKFDSGTGWPSFNQPHSHQSLEEKEDKSLLMKRTEVICSKCGSHLGHVFPDGPGPDGLRYCINSLSLDFKSVDDEKNQSTSSKKE